MSFPFKQSDKLTHVAFVLDKSGSMQSCIKPTIDGYNEQLQVLRKSDHPVKLTLVQFNGQVEFKCVDEPFENVDREMTNADYQPNGSTAMYDAVYQTITKLESLDGKGKDEAFLVVVLSDGQNTDNNGFRNTLAEKVQQVTSTGRWTFNYIGSNQDLSKLAADLNIPMSNMTRYASTNTGTQMAFNKSAGDLGKYFGGRTRGLTASTSYANDTNEVADVS